MDLFWTDPIKVIADWLTQLLTGWGWPAMLANLFYLTRIRFCRLPSNQNFLFMNRNEQSNNDCPIFQLFIELSIGETHIIYSRSNQVADMNYSPPIGQGYDPCFDGSHRNNVSH